jgi:hypothetical protein
MLWSRRLTAGRNRRSRSLLRCVASGLPLRSCRAAHATSEQWSIATACPFKQSSGESCHAACVSFTSWLTDVPSASSPHWITSLATRNFVSVVARFSFSIARALALPVLRPRPFAWAVTLVLARALASSRSGPLTPQFPCPPLPTSIRSPLPLLGFLAPSSILIWHLVCILIGISCVSRYGIFCAAAVFVCRL